MSLYEYEITFNKPKGRGINHLTVTLVTSKTEAELRSNKDNILRYAFAKTGKKADYDNWELDSLRIVTSIEPSST